MLKQLTRIQETEIYVLATQAKATAADVKQYWAELERSDIRNDVTRLAGCIDQLAEAIRKLII